MEDYVAITKLNDFNYNPKSLYFSSCYQQFDKSTFEDTPQIQGKYSHDNIQEQFASKDIFVDKWVIEDELRIYGKIDLYNKKTCQLIERKNLIKKIYIGYLLQVYAQYYGLISMGYKVKDILIYSIKDKKEFTIQIPKEPEYQLLKTAVESIRNYQSQDIIGIQDNFFKDINTNYNQLFF